MDARTDEAAARFNDLVRTVAAGTASEEDFNAFGELVLQKIRATLRFFEMDEEHTTEVWLHFRKHLEDTARAANPWLYFLLLLKRKAIDIWRRERGRREREVGFDQLQALDDDRPPDEVLPLPDAAPGPAEVSSFGEDWARLTAFSAQYQNADHAALYRCWACGDRIHELAREFGLTENAVQLAVTKVRTVVSRAFLSRDRQKTERILAEYPGRDRGPWLWQWLAGAAVETIAREQAVPRAEVQTALRDMVKFIASRWLALD